MGAMSLRENLIFYPSTRLRGLRAGSTGVVFQSGGTFMFWLQRAGARGLGFTYAVSSGNELNLDLADYINFLVEDENTKMIACMAEGIRRGDAFLAAAEKALKAEKPVVLVKVGRSAAGQEAARSHTGALASDDAVFEAACRKVGVTRCYSLDEMIETCLVFDQRRWPRGRRIGFVGYSGGGKGLFLDYCDDEGAVMGKLSQATMDQITPVIDPGLPAQVPVDCGAGIAARQKDYSKICQLVARDDGIDIMTMQGQLPMIAEDPADPTVFSDVLDSCDKPVIAHVRVSQNATEAGVAFQDKAGVPFVQGLSQTVRTIRFLADYAERLRRGAQPLPAATGKAADLEGTAFDRLLAANGLTPPKSALGKTPAEAAKAAAGVGFPVALKIVSPEASHKTEVGGVSLNLADQPAVEAAAAAMAARLKVHDPSAQIDGFLAQEMVAGVEMILGVREDAQFGPFMVVGLGGIAVEAMRDVAFRLLPVTPEDAREMLDELRGKALLGAFRGRPARDIGALVKAICGLSAIFADHRGRLSDLEVNPLIVLEDGKGVRAVDVRPVARG
jgi:acetyltransferase